VLSAGISQTELVDSVFYAEGPFYLKKGAASFSETPVLNILNYLDRLTLSKGKICLKMYCFETGF
jgi:hypothetical protein